MTSSPPTSKTTAAVAYLAVHRRNHLHPLSLGHLLFLADTQHVQRWGRPVGDVAYQAGANGPYLKAWPTPAMLIAARPHDTLSASDLMVLDEVLANVQGCSPNEIALKARNKVWRHVRQNRTTRTDPEVRLEDFAWGSPERDQLLAHLRDRHPGEAPPR